MEDLIKVLYRKTAYFRNIYKKNEELRKLWKTYSRDC